MSFIKQNRFSSLWMIPVGIGIDYLGVRLVNVFGLPLYLDSIGTILTAALCGYLPGILVGFFSNFITSLSDSVSFYYSTLSILIAIVASRFAQRGVFSRFRSTLLTIPVFVLIGGGLGSVLTWLLAGFRFGSGISAPLTAFLYQNGFPAFGAQLSADLLMDLPDKLICVTVVYVILHIIPAGWYRLFPFINGFHAQKPDTEKHYRRYSLHTQIALMITLSVLIVNILCTTVSFLIYENSNRESYSKQATGIANMMIQEIPADRIDAYLDDGELAPDYNMVKNRLILIQQAFPTAQYFYVYQIRADGCHVVFDLNTANTKGSSPGAVIPFDAGFVSQLADLLAGREIPPIVTNGTYGWLLTVYRPIVNSAGKCVAYACVDIAMNQLMEEQAIFLVRMESVSFGALLILIWITISLADRWIAKPVNCIAAAADHFACQSEEDRVISCNQMNQLAIHTGNEVENLYNAISRSMTDMAQYISHIKEQDTVISTMQYNVITTFADMVENRDENTGEHVRRTAEYVEILAKQLQLDGKYPLLTDQMIRDMRASAPLHDIGKIRVPDRILNKPGRLTEEEFAEMKLHAAAGKMILEEATRNLGSFSYLNTAADMAGSHHEWWNGKGYPNGGCKVQIFRSVPGLWLLQTYLMP